MQPGRRSRSDHQRQWPLRCLIRSFALQVWREVASGPELSLEDLEMGLLALLGFVPPEDELQRIYTEHAQQGWLVVGSVRL